METYVCWVVRVAAVVAWALVVVDAAIPGEVWMLGRVEGLVFLVAGVSTVSLAARYMHRPIQDVFDAGREFERRRILEDAGVPEPLEKYRHARAS